jgi:hypothetical protein
MVYVSICQFNRSQNGFSILETLRSQFVKRKQQYVQHSLNQYCNNYLIILIQNDMLIQRN